MSSFSFQTMDYVFKNDNPDYLVSNATTVEKLGHAFHMHEIWVQAQTEYNRYSIFVGWQKYIASHPFVTSFTYTILPTSNTYLNVFTCWTQVLRPHLTPRPQTPPPPSPIPPKLTKKLEKVLFTHPCFTVFVTCCKQVFLYIAKQLFYIFFTIHYSIIFHQTKTK